MLLLSTAYLPPIQTFAHLYYDREAVVDEGEHYVKQTYRNRCVIATASGPQTLTLPVERAAGSHAPVASLRLSAHGDWPRVHWQALVSAYEQSPYFDYYADDFQTLYRRPPAGLADFNHALLTLMLRLLDLECSLTRSSRYVTPHESMTDLRTVISPKASPGADPRFEPRPYYQVFAARTGFLPRLSMVDLLFHMGPESRLILRDSLRR